MRRIRIIAEVGVNHNRSLTMAKEMIDVAAEAGADIVKFQAAIPTEVVTAYAEKAAYQKVQTPASESQLEMTRKLHFDLDAFHELKEYCGIKGIEYLVTSFGPESSSFVLSQKPRLVKIPSGEITNVPYLRRLALTDVEIILSTGMATLDEVEFAINTLVDAGQKRDGITLLHCTTEYPTPYNEVNLNAISTMRKHFGLEVGISDHSNGIIIPIASVGMGASVIEKHFTLDKSLPGPDHKASLQPDELIEMVKAIRNIEVAMGDGKKLPTVTEMQNMTSIRKSIVASKNIISGEMLTEFNLTTKRPGNGLSPIFWDAAIGTRAIKDFEVDEQIVL